MKKIQDININYEQHGKGKDIVLLHGWGQNIEMMRPLVKRLVKDCRVTLIDLPGFGLSQEASYPLTVYDYAEIINQLLKTLKVKKPSFIGHSFGGKVSLVYASKYEVDKLVLLASPAFASSEKMTLKLRVLKFAKKLPFLSKLEAFAKKHMGSSDYRSASEIMRQTLVATVSTDVSSDAKKIKASTLLIWGDKDEAVSLDDARKLEALIPESALIVLPGTHHAYLENIRQVLAILDEFL